MTARAGSLGAALVVACAFVPAATASIPILLPSVRTTMTPGPPLTSAAAGGETLYPPGMTSDEQVEVGVDRGGKPVSVAVLQRLRLDKLGDYSFVVPGPIVDVAAARGSDSQPGLRRGAILWAGFSSGKKTLGARATLDTPQVSSLLPLRLSVTRDGDALVVRGEDATAASAPVLVGSMRVKDGLKALRTTRNSLTLGIAAPDVYANVSQTPASRPERIAAPLDVRGRIGDASFHYVLGDGRPLTFERRIEHVPDDAKLHVVVTPTSPVRILQRHPRTPAEALTLVSLARLTVARSLQYEAFLANPNPTGRSTTTYVYDTAKQSAGAGVIVHTGKGKQTWPTFLAIALVVLGAGGLVVLWAHS